MSTTTLDSPYLNQYQEKANLYDKVNTLGNSPTYQGLETLTKLEEEYDDEFITETKNSVRDHLYSRAKINRMLHLSKRGGPRA